LRVYIAAPWVRRDEAKAVGERLIAAGHEVTSRWFQHQGDPNDSTGSTLDQIEVRRQAGEDVIDVCRADALVVLNLEKSEGKAVETGIAIANGIPVISVGKRSNIFQSLGWEVETVDDALLVLQVLPYLVA
jgi:nucleoside 2-deoxyribosyltransferase